MNEYLLENEITIITNATRDTLFSENPDALLLYMFYIKGTSIQKTNSIWYTDSFVKKGLKWGDDKLKKAKETLKKHNLIEEFQVKDTNGLFGKKFVKVGYLWKQDSKKELINKLINREGENRVTVELGNGLEETNALSNYKLNALSNLNLNALSKEEKKSKSKKTKNKNIEDLNATEREILDLYNSLFRNKRPSIDTSWVDNFNEWLEKYDVDVIKEAIINWEKYPHWSKDGNSKNGLPWLFRTRDRSGDAVNYIDQLLALGDTPAKKHRTKEDEEFARLWENAL